MQTVGDRIRSWRRRRGGMSQKTLAELAGFSQTYISHIESGQKPLDRKSTQAAIAEALNITVPQLLGQPGDDIDPARARATVHVPAIESSVVEISYGERRKPQRDKDSVREAVRDATELRNGANYARLTVILPDLLFDLAGHGGDLAPDLIEALATTQTTLENLGFKHLAREVAQLGVRTAESHADPTWVAQARYCLAWSVPPTSSSLAYRMALQAAEEVPTAAGRDAQDVYGRLHLFAALNAAAALRGDQSFAHLGEAIDVARALGEPERYGTLSAGFTGSWFGPTNVDLWRIAVAAELGDTGTALSVADGVDLDALPVPNRHIYYWIDVARALAAGGKDTDAMHALGRAERAAPQHFRLNGVAINMVTTLIARAKRRAVGRELAALARKLGLDPI